MNTPRLQNNVALLFPDEYTSATWKDLLPRFIAWHIDSYEKVAHAYMQTLPDQPTAEQRQAHPYPVMADDFVEACELLATERGFTFQSLACYLFLGREKVAYYKQRSEELNELCQEYVELTNELYEENKRLKQSSTLGKWLN